MPRKRFTPEQIIPKLREAEVELSRGKTDGRGRHSAAVVRGHPSADLET